MSTINANETPRVLPIPSYISEREGKKFSVINGSIYYNKRRICRFFNTSRGCRNGDNCSFVHVKLGCAYFFRAIQGCMFPSEECPFSHSLDSVVLSKAFRLCPTCKVNECLGIVCMRCNNEQNNIRKKAAEKFSKEQECVVKESIKTRFISALPTNLPPLISNSGAVVDPKGPDWAD